MKKEIIKVLFAVMVLGIASCHNENTQTSSIKRKVYTLQETFTSADQPEIKYLIPPDTFKLETPWGYNRVSNSTRKYPIVINGCWGEGVYFSEDVRKKYPSFYLDFNNYYTDADGEMLAGLIDIAISQNYRFDTERIYLTGFSQGGSGSFKIVRGMLKKGKLFAAIIRVAGQSESVLADSAVAKTSIWYHIGLDDDVLRVNVASDTYSNLKTHTYNANAVESILTDNIAGYSRTTRTLTKDGVDIVKMSEYTGVGHTPDPCYKDPEVFDWLFNNTLSFR
jgi:hypothetical protein